MLTACDYACICKKENSKQERETWWWDDTEQCLIRNKRKLWKEWQEGSKEQYLDAKMTTILGGKKEGKIKSTYSYNSYIYVKT